MDHIKNLLSQTGWSYEVLLQKLNEFRNSPPVSEDSDSSETQPKRSNNIEGSESRQEIKECFADSRLTEAQESSGNDEGKESRRELKKCSPCDADLSPTLELCQPKDEQREVEAQHQLNNEDENQGQQDIKMCSSSSSGVRHQVTSKEQSNNQQEFKVPFPCKGNSSLMHKNPSPGNADARLTEGRNKLNIRKGHKLKKPCVNEAPDLSQIKPKTSNCDFGNNKVDSCDHNYFKKTNVEDCNLTDCVQKSVLLRGNRVNESECVASKRRTKRKVVNFRNSFLCRIRRSYRRRRRHKKVKRTQLIPQQSRRNSEGIRNKILQQLELLRNRRTSDFGRDLYQTIPPGLTEPVLYKKRLSNEKVRSLTPSTSRACDTLPVTHTDNDDGKTKEAISVQEPLSVQYSADCYVIKPTKTKDITKIKGWKHKKFVSVDDLNTSKNLNIPSSKHLNFVPTPSSSYKEEPNKNQRDVSSDNQEANESVSSAFASDNLDGFLCESNSNRQDVSCNSRGANKSAASAFASNNLDGFLYESNPNQRDVSCDNQGANKSAASAFASNNLDEFLYESNPNQRDVSCDNQGANKSAASAFASNNLDGFLYESADLHISFQIPKLASGEDCINSTPAVSTPAFTTNIASVIKPPKNEPEEEEEDEDENVESTIISGDTENLLKIHKITNLYKPRTVAQRRRIWRLKSDAKVRQDENVRKPRTLAEKRRLMDVGDESKKNFNFSAKRSASETNFFDEDLKYSYVQYRGKKLRVPTLAEKGVIAYIKYSYNKKDYIYVPKKRKMSSNKNKPSIFNINSAVKADALKYRPGPLCRKLKLQEENKTWRTVIKKLPKVYLEVTPQVNRPIHPSLLRFLPDYQFDVTPERLEFALSAVYDKNHPSNSATTFKFPVAYANREESLLFREKIILGDVKLEPQEDSELLLTDVVKDVISKMLDYVETKDVADDIFIKEDVNIRCRDEEIIVSSTTTVNTKRKPKKSKTNYELKRLNVKVIEVNLEDKGDVLNCNKEYCKLGCVCKSLATTSSLVSNHCGIPDCMFQCTCNYDRKSRGNLKITLPVGIDVLSEGAVSRLEDEAKKNLAKVEKEFTQTVIQANNQTIVVGGHCNRQRRLTKAPRKYNDFVDDPDILLQNGNEPAESYEPPEEIKVQPQIQWKPCSIKVHKLKLQQLIPFCLVHNLHNCHCDYKAQYKAMPVTESNTAFECSIKKAGDEYVPKTHPNSDCQSSARTRGISTAYYVVRNRTQEFITTRKKKLEKLYKEYIEKLYKGAEIDVYAYSEMEVIKVKEKDENIEIDDKQVSRSTRRKQQLTVREDNITLQTVKKPEPKKKSKLKPKDRTSSKNASAKSDEKKNATEPKQAEENKKAEQPSKTPNVNTSASELNNVVKDDTLPKFDNLLLSSRHTTELLTPSSAVRKKFLQLLGKKNECDAQFRLMPWSGLASRYETSKLQLWYSSFYKVPKIIVTDSVVVPRHFTNVKHFENIQDKSAIKVDLIRWLVTKTVPGGKKSDDVLVILQLTKTHCEVCGICEKTCISSQSSENMLLALIPSFLTQNNTKDTSTSTEAKDKETTTETIEANTLFNFETVDEQKKQHVIVKKIKFSKCKYPEVVLQETDNIDSSLTEDNTTKRILSTHLPHINKNSQWRMVQLNSDFSILSLLRNSYAIKYSDLLRIVRMAQATYTTIVLKTPEVEQNYPHPDFGIYAAPNCEEKVFIGPYFYYEGHDVSTLRYVNRVLVKTELFNQMKGIAPMNNGCWLKQLQGQQVEKKNLQTIDLTLCDSDNETEFIETQSQETSVKYSPSPRSLLKHPLNTNGDKEQETSVNNIVVVSDTIEATIQEKLSSEKNLFTVDDVANFEMSAVDFEVHDSSSDCVLEEDDAVNVCNFENQVYFVPNVPLMGYILAHKLRTITIVRWPTLNNAKRFYKVEEAVLWLEKELSEYFIVPPNFTISIKVKTELTPGISEPFDPKYLRGYYLATKYGVKSLLNINIQSLKLLEVTSKELELLARRRARKMIYDKSCEIAKQFVPQETLKAKSCSEVIDLIISEIKKQKRAEVFYIDKQQRLLSKKEKLVNNLSLVIKDISPYVSNKTQSAMLDILKRHKTPPAQVETSTEKSDVVCITIDSDEETSPDSIENTQSNVLPPKPAETPPLVIPKITVRNLHDLRDPNLSSTLDTTNTIILTKKKKSEVPKTIRVKNLGVLMSSDGAAGAKNNISFETKFEKIHLFPVLKRTSKGLSHATDESADVKESTDSGEENVQEARGLKRKLRPIFPAISKCVIKAPTGKLIRVNADQLKNIQNRSIFLAPITKETSPQDGGMTVITNHSSHGGFVKINLDDAVSTQFLRKTSDSSHVQSGDSS